MFTANARPFRGRTSGLVCGVAVASLAIASCSSSDDAAPASTENATTDSSTDEPVSTEADTVAPVDTATTSADTDTTSPDTEPDDTTSPEAGLDVSRFFDGALVGEPTIEDCTLSGGAETMCYTLTVSGYPSSYEVSQFCPRTITDEAGGLWWDGEELYDLNGEFIENLAEIYGDDAWQMYDEDGNVQYTETAEEFDLAARPDVDPSLQNHCVEGRLEWLDNGEPIAATVQIPTTPVAADAPTAPQGDQGVTLDGVLIAAAAPVDAILSAYTIAAFDDCGAHFNPIDGYHLHGAVGCSEHDHGDLSEGETAQFGYAMDGYPVHSPLPDGSDVELDECGGHTTDELGYHYHANSAEENQVIECLIGQTVASADEGAGGGGAPPEGPPPGEG